MPDQKIISNPEAIVKYIAIAFCHLASACSERDFPLVAQVELKRRLTALQRNVIAEEWNLTLAAVGALTDDVLILSGPRTEGARERSA